MEGTTTAGETAARTNLHKATGKAGHSSHLGPTHTGEVDPRMATTKRLQHICELL